MEVYCELDIHNVSGYEPILRYGDATFMFTPDRLEFNNGILETPLYKKICFPRCDPGCRM